jgi:hypothetical protein
MGRRASVNSLMLFTYPGHSGYLGFRIISFTVPPSYVCETAHIKIGIHHRKFPIGGDSGEAENKIDNHYT